MITLKSALKIISDFTFSPDTEKISLTDAYDRVLAIDLISDINIPPFDKSAMDTS
jgi:molybdopterin molybdotransferase